MNLKKAAFFVCVSLAILLIPALVPAPAAGAITIDASVSKNQSPAATTVVTPAFSTTSNNELLLAFVETDYLSGANTTVTGVTGGGLTWALVVRSNAQSGSSEIWRAFSPTPLTNVTVTASLSQKVVSSITLMSLSGVDTSGVGGSGAIGATKNASSAKGAPTATLTTTQNGSWVFGVGNDYDNATNRTTGAGQALVNQYLTPTGDTYWVQMESAPTPLSGTAVTINDTAPTGDRYNLAICEVLSDSTGGSPTYTLSGSLGSGGSGAAVALSGDAVQNATADGNGNYSFTNLLSGTYTVTPSKAGFAFNPASQQVTITNANVGGINFTASALTWTISGTISPAAGGNGATVSLSGTSTATTTADSSGNYSFGNLVNGPYTVTPSNTGYTFNPASKQVTVANANVAGINFTASSATLSISGTISPATAGNGATVTLSGTSSATTTADSSGSYSFGNLTSGSYTVTPSKTGFTFNPASQQVSLTTSNASGIDFTGSAATWTISGTISPATAGSAATVTLGGASTGTTTADSSGNYSFANLSNGVYSVTPSKTGYSFTPTSQSVTVNNGNPVPANFTGQAATGTSALAIDATVFADGASASSTLKTAAFNTTSPNELLLAFISTDYLKGANTTVTAVAGAGLTWSLVVRTNAQSGSSEIWRAFAPAALSNVTVTATLSQSVVSSIAVVSFTGADPTGSNGAAAIGATKSASAAKGAPTASLVTTRNNSWVFGVGNDFDNAIPRTPAAGQSLVHQYLTPTGDTYWVQMQNATTDASGSTVTMKDTAPTADRYNFSIVEVLPAIGSGTGAPPTVSMTSPAPNGIVTSKATVSANATSSSSAITGVQFLLDGANLGAEVTTPPYSMTWDTTTVNAGTHTLSAIAYDSSDQSTTAAPVTVTVDNSGNPAIVGSWSSPVSLPAVAVNLVLQKDGTLLFYQDGSTPTIWDYINNRFTNVSIPVDLFCSGHAMMADGRILVVGGYGGSSNKIGISNAEIFDRTDNSWTIVPKMAYSRWYPTATTLSDGRILVTAGWQTTNHTNAGVPEIYDPSTNNWTQLNNANNPFETYPFMFMLSDGRVIHVGGSEYATDTEVLDISAQTWTVVDSRIIDGGSATMYQPGKIMKAGSAADSQDVGASSNTTFTLDLTQPSPKWQQAPSMAYARSFMNLTMLPDGTALATGGESDKNGGNVSNAVYAAELWSPATQTWTTMASMHTPREYHGTALLLPDGRVLESGMGADFGNVPDQLSAEFYSPPYLFKGARPTITQAPSQVQFGANFFVATPDGATITSAVLIRTGAVTHFFDQNTRFVPVPFVQAAGGLTITAPANGFLAPPGFYMLFLVNSNGVPSIAPILQLTP